MSRRLLLGYFVTYLLFLGTSMSTLQNLCNLPKSCSEAEESLSDNSTDLPPCRCDRNCQMYDDCCFDKPDLLWNETGSQPRSGQIPCQLFPAVEKNYYVFFVSRCPDSFPDGNLAVQCNNSTIRSVPYDRYPKNLTIEYVLKKLPVTSKVSGILYRNAFCAICHGDLDFTFWELRVESIKPAKVNYTALPLTDLLGFINGYRVSYRPPSAELAPRGCSKNHVAECPPDWIQNETEETESVKSKCRSYQSYVQTPETIYRNAFCARCNQANETDMTCSNFAGKVVAEAFPNPLPYSVLLDFNSDLWDFLTAPNSILGNGPSNDDDPANDCNSETLMNATETNGTDSSQNPCAQDSTYRSRNSGKTTGDLILAYLTFVGNILSVVSLSFLLLAYCCIPSLRNTPGRSLMCLCVSLMLAQLLFAAFGNYDNQIPSFNSAQVAAKSGNETETNALDQLENETETNASDQFENETETNAFDKLENETETVDQYDEIETARNSSTVLDEGRSSVATNVGRMSDGKIEGPVTVPYSDGRREVLAYESSLEDVAPTTAGTPSASASNPVTWTFRKDAKSIFCYASSLVSHYFFLSYLFWSNAMAIDVWRTFRTLSSSLPSQADIRRRHFVYYSIYSWSAPAAIVTVAVVTDTVGAIVRPLYAVRFCWISNPLGLLVFLYVPCLLITAANILLFILSSVNICFSSMDDVQSRFGGRGLEGRQRLFLYVRLAAVMGVTWVSGLLASVTKSTVLWYVYVVTTAYQGVYIGLCFMATNQMRKVIREKIKLNYASSVMTTKSTVK